MLRYDLALGICHWLDLLLNFQTLRRSLFSFMKRLQVETYFKGMPSQSHVEWLGDAVLSFLLMLRATRIKLGSHLCSKVIEAG